MTDNRLREDMGLLAMALVCALLLAITALCGGCGATTARKAILTASEATEVAVKETRAYCRKLAITVCKVNPCPVLASCQKGERFLGHGAAALQEGLKEINKAIPDE